MEESICYIIHIHAWAADQIKYLKVARSNMSRLEAHAGFFRLLMKEIFDPCVVTF